MGDAMARGFLCEKLLSNAKNYVIMKPFVYRQQKMGCCKGEVL